LAIVDRTASGPNEFAPNEGRLQAAPGDGIRAFDAEGRTVNLTIVGVLEQALQFTSGVFVDQDVVRTVFPAQERYNAYFFQMAPSADIGAFRTDLERVVFSYGLQPIDIREEVRQAFTAAGARWGSSAPTSGPSATSPTSLCSAAPGAACSSSSASPRSRRSRAPLTPPCARPALLRPRP